jgi:hypothetical protein
VWNLKKRAKVEVSTSYESCPPPMARLRRQPEQLPASYPHA